MDEKQYGYVTSLGKVDFEDALGRVTAALKEQGFGVLTQIDVKETMKKKLDQDFRPYRILGACNPLLAHQALTADPLIGLLLPCNLVVEQEDDGEVRVAAIKPAEMLSVVDHPRIEGVAAQVDEKVRRVLSSLET